MKHPSHNQIIKKVKKIKKGEDTYPELENFDKKLINLLKKKTKK